MPIWPPSFFLTLILISPYLSPAAPASVKQATSLLSLSVHAKLRQAQVQGFLASSDGGGWRGADTPTPAAGVVSAAPGDAGKRLGMAWPE
uniref:Uncharacterized protein n=1 Tax=Setaria viridis TaxID=4556 RepID=A0A4U6TIG4_SETVI|nr:hypothetical protein SEVIR_8G127233v2 [Setaria viridis]